MEDTPLTERKFFLGEALLDPQDGGPRRGDTYLLSGRFPRAALSPEACAVTSGDRVIHRDRAPPPKDDPAALSLEPAQLQAACPRLIKDTVT